MWRQVCWPPTLLLSAPACRPVPRPTHHLVRRQVRSLLTIGHCLAKFLGLHFCLCLSQRIKQCFGLHFDFSLHSLISGHHSQPYLRYRISRSCPPVPRQPHRAVCHQSSWLPSFLAWQQVCWQVSRPSHAFTSLSASVLSNALTSTLLRVSRHVCLPFSILACMQELLPVPRLSHHVVCLHFP